MLVVNKVSRINLVAIPIEGDGVLRITLKVIKLNFSTGFHAVISRLPQYFLRLLLYASCGTERCVVRLILQLWVELTECH